MVYFGFAVSSSGASREALSVFAFVFHAVDVPNSSHSFCDKHIYHVLQSGTL